MLGSCKETQLSTVTVNFEFSKFIRHVNHAIYKWPVTTIEGGALASESTAHAFPATAILPVWLQRLVQGNYACGQMPA